MIKVFSRLRRQMISDGRLRKYILYALGEIILVVIGILIAIKINNYNTEIDRREILEDKLENVVLEIRKNIDQLNSTLDKSSAILSSCRDLANAISNQNILSSGELSEVLGNSFAPVLNYQPQTAFLNEMIETGTLRDLPNEELKLMLLNVQPKISELKSQEQLHLQDQKAITDYMLEHGDFKAVMDDTGVSSRYLKINTTDKHDGNQVLLDSKQFENMLILFMASGLGLQDGNYKKFKSEMELIVKAIETELKNHD